MAAAAAAEPRLVQKMIADHVAETQSLQNDFEVCHLVKALLLFAHPDLGMELL